METLLFLKSACFFLLLFPKHSPGSPPLLRLPLPSPLPTSHSVIRLTFRIHSLHPLPSPPRPLPYLHLLSSLPQSPLRLSPGALGGGLTPWKLRRIEGLRAFRILIVLEAFKALTALTAPKALMGLKAFRTL